MKAYNKSRSETIKEIRRINRNLSARLKRIEGDENLPQFAVEGYNKFIKRHNLNSLETMTDQQLTTILRDITYLNDLKSARVLGARYTAKIYLPIKEKLEALSPDQRKRAWKIYEKIQGGTGLIDRFKYEVVATATDYIYGGQGDDEAIEEVIREFQTVYERFGGNIDNAKARVLFTEKLDALRREFE